MNTILKYTCPIALAIALTACGGSNSTKSEPITTASDLTDSSTTITQPEAVYNLHPDDVAEYVEEFKYKYDQLELQIDGVQYDISVHSTDVEKKVIYARYEKGFLSFGFDFIEGVPLAKLYVIETGTEDLGAAHEEVDAYLAGYDISIEFDDDNAIYTGRLNNITQQDFNVRLIINDSVVSSGSTTLAIEGAIATVKGELGTKTYIQVQDLINNNPEVTTLLLQTITGSVDDDINSHTGRLVRNAQLTTKVEKGSRIYSGGVDLFASGYQRVYESGAIVGVHSWCCESGKTADQLSKDDPAHKSQLTYFREMLGDELGPEFYFFTINAAPFDSIHEMSDAEMSKYLLKDD